MENHPIPQDITGFQFKLIGNMTIKQFAYLGGGIVMGWILFALPIPGIIKYPVSFFFGLTGVALAFLPYEGRPLDIMISNFFNALFKPTQFVYQKSGGLFYCPPISARAVMDASSQKTADAGSLSGERLQSFLGSLPKRSKNKLDEKEMVFFQSLSGLSQPLAIPTNADPSYVAPKAFFAQITQVQPQKEPEEKETTDSSQAKEENLENETKHLQEELNEAKKMEESQKNTTSYDTAHEKVLELEKLLNETVAQKQALENQLLFLHKQLQQEKITTYRPSIATPDVKEQTKNVHLVPKEMGKKIGLPAPSEFPNIIAGIVKDPRDNPLPNILVEVKDNAGNPVRAFKTSALGQFSSATPLTNGTYTIEFDDPKAQNKFDAIEFSANGEIILPLEVISVDTREELRKSLFTN